MKKYLKYTSCILATLAVSACVTTTKHNVRQANDDKAGKIIVYTGEQSETVGVFLNDKFIAALPNQHQVTHKLCAGNYQLKVRSVTSANTAHKHSTQLVGQQTITVAKGQTQYYAVKRTPNGWALETTSAAPKGLKASDDKLVRRIPDAMLQCK